MLVKRNSHNKNNKVNQSSEDQKKARNYEINNNPHVSPQKDTEFRGSRFAVFGMEEECLEDENIPDNPMNQEGEEVIVNLENKQGESNSAICRNLKDKPATSNMI